MRKIYAILFFLILGLGSSFAQEICDNGIDDDGDGLIDCADCDDCGSFSACVLKDNDGDGIADGCDLDDDNDGIPDTTECPQPPINAQTDLALAGSAVALSSTEVQLTPAQNNQAGSFMSGDGTGGLPDVRVNLEFNFELSYQVNLGSQDGNGADGIAFVMHNDPAGSAAVGASGSGIGAQGIQDGVFIEFDTWRNGGDDLVNDHIQIRNTELAIADPAGALSGAPVDLGNIETGTYYDVSVTWNAASSTLAVVFDPGGINASLSYTDANIINNLLGGDTTVYWGFTSSTGGANNDQRIQGIMIRADQCTVDTDGDGIVDSFDEDSDNDGCLDAIEGDSTFGSSDLSGNRLGGGVQGNGIPTVAGNGQGNGTSKVINTEVYYMNCVAELNVSCGQLITPSDVLAIELPNDSLENIFSVTIVDEFGRTLSNPLPSDYEGEFWIFLSNECNDLTCETEGRIDNKRGCLVTNTLDTTVWCIDEFLTIDPDSDYYRDMLNLRPYAVENCTYDTLEVTYEGEWIETFECGDTLKQLIRGWRTTTKAGNSCVGYDTITVIRLPNISQHMYVPQKDTVNCVLGTYIWHNFKHEYHSWKQIVGVHSDTTFIRYPYDHSRSVDVTEIWTAWNVLPEGNLKDSLEREYRKEAVILRWDANALAYDTFSVLELYENTSGLFRQIDIDGERYVEFAVRKGDRVMTNGGAYNVVDDNWFYEKYTHGFWVDLTFPNIYDEAEITICDLWEYKCNGVEVILPNTPYNADTCQVFCLDELAANTKCLEVVHTEEKDLGGNCPRVVKRHTQIKQSCFASGNSLSTLGALTNCPRDTNTSGLVVNSFGAALDIEAEQWIMYIDTIAPLVDPKQDSFELVFNTDGHSCMGDVVLPQIEVKDVCSGVKEVKATIGVGNKWIVYNDEDGDGVWTAEAGRTIQVVCGESYPVQYEILDSCHNKTMVTRNWVSVEDREAPLALMADTLTVSIGGKEVWLDGETFDRGSSDNCSIARVLVRRTDWLSACGVDVCLDDLEGLTTEAELDAFIRAYGITAGLNDNAIEQYYAEQYEWLVNDGDWCPLTAKEEAAGLVSFKDQLVAGWENDIKAIWAESCIGVDEHGNSIIDVSSEFNLGGGWGSKVPVCCEDVCEEIVVEMLVIDKNCNYTKGWTIVNVEDNSMVEEACKFEELTISCNSYAANYAALVEAAQAGEEGAYEALDEALGSLIKGWRSPDNKLVDYAGEELSKTIEYVTSSCKLEVVERKVLDTAHDGEVIWVTVQEPRTVIVYDTIEADLGGVYQLCGSECIPSVWVELDDCGLGKITRRWEVYGGCANSAQFEAHRGEGLIFDQVIYVTPSCELNKYSLSVPNDTSICSPLVYSLDGNVDVDGGRVEYLLEDVGCRQLGISYSDEVFDVVGNDDIYKIHRTWMVSDWCDDVEVTCVQKIIVDTDCSAPAVQRAQSKQANDFELYQNTPNPLMESGVIRFRLPEATEATLTLYDVSGRVLYELSQQYDAGEHQVLINKSDLGMDFVSGAVLYQLETSKYSATKQMLILR